MILKIAEDPSSIVLNLALGRPNLSSRYTVVSSHHGRHHKSELLESFDSDGAPFPLRRVPVDAVYAYQISFGVASGQVLRRSQETLLFSSVNPRYRIRETNV
jgi:hypothetical protein